MWVLWLKKKSFCLNCGKNPLHSRDSMSPNKDSKKFSPLEIVNNNKTTFFCEGIAFTLLGIFALLMPTVFSLTLDYFLGWVLILGAIALGIRTFQTRTMPNHFASVLSTCVYLFLGFMFLAYPISGIMALTLLLGCFFLFDGITKIYGSVRMKEVPAWRWLFCSGILSVVLAVLIIVTWPTDVPWIPGVLFGINFLVTGIAILGFLWSLHRFNKSLQNK
jgi:uncharacterized membrane protein HdeD (DUF308 family)